MARGAHRTGVPLPYDFRRPNKFSREHQRALQIASETFARQFTTLLSTTLRTVSQVQVSSVSQMTYDEYIQEIPNPSYLAVLSMNPLPGPAVLHLPLPMIMTVVDRLLGGTGTGAIPQRPLTDIEDNLMKVLLGRVLRELSYAFEALIHIDPQILLHESNPQFAQAAAATDMVIVLAFDVRIAAVSGEATLCLPFAAMQPILDEVTANSHLAGREVTDPAVLRAAIQQRVGDAPVEVAVRFGEIGLTGREVIALRAGDVVPLRHRTDQPLAVCVAGVDRFAALAGRRGNRLACVLVDPDAPLSPGA